MDKLQNESLPTLEASAISAYCLQCESGFEQEVANLIHQMFEGVRAYPVMQEKHQSRDGVKSTIRVNLLPGYVFLYAAKSPPFREILVLHRVFRFLNYGEFEAYTLQGADLDFALWVLRHGGLLTTSRAVQAGSEVKIVYGPLLDAVGVVERIDRRNRNVRLAIAFDGNVRRVWMPFDWTDEGGGFKAKPDSIA